MSFLNWKKVQRRDNKIAGQDAHVYQDGRIYFRRGAWRELLKTIDHLIQLNSDDSLTCDVYYKEGFGIGIHVLILMGDYKFSPKHNIINAKLPKSFRGKKLKIVSAEGGKIELALLPTK